MDWLFVMEVFDLSTAGLLIGFLVGIGLRARIKPSESPHDGDALGDQDEADGAEIASEAD